MEKQIGLLKSLLITIVFLTGKAVYSQNCEVHVEYPVNPLCDPITYTVSGGGTGATIVGLPPGVSGLFSGGVFTITGTPSTEGTYNYTVSTTGTCSQTTLSGTNNVLFSPTASISIDNNTVCQNGSFPIKTFTYD